MEYKYYISSYNGIETLYRIQEGRIRDSAGTLESFQNGGWSSDLNPIKSFMNRYASGWLDEDDAMDYKTAIGALRKKIDEARSFAAEKHGNQKYGRYPYEVHLINVINVLLRNDILPDTEMNIDLWSSAWLHDVLEDTDTARDEIIDRFGIHIFEIVWSLSDGKGEDRKEKKQAMYEKIVLNQNAIIIKLADRIANLEFSIIDNNQEKIKLYIDENDDLNQYLANRITEKEGLALLDYLNSLIGKMKL
ncbi:bifunctional (p)ppGpp synthetase/guanosine-3',5'-bis(diphosphate) 3'-pyrophosphohydrolase [Flavobacterium zhairuonense]|uniref:HD domain-containing protein n=1 Tax=Flavobacterium zhairuonense TaxID=2493631 RepID=UPI00105174E9|nr:HD domain-containing protein [Flavobacterium zhairuonense]KAF2508678.1 bifunctional (p)ppGpp synthetase/guanosine-3',5'-bis(diphosphate) 3'-pyrophosphohydrolase [Flavobacterium zhairuonense]